MAKKLNDYTEHFVSIAALINAVENREQNPSITSKSSHTEPESWTGTKDFNEAKNLLLNGWSAPLPEFKQAIRGLNTTTTRREPRTAPRGYAPHVPNAIQGKPYTMIDSRTRPQNTRTIDIYYNNTVSVDIEAEEVKTVSLNLVSAINNIEKQGIKTKLNAVIISLKQNSNGGQRLISTVLLKDYSSPLNLQKLAFPLIHPSFLRRIGFRWLETLPTYISKEFDAHYGIIETSKFTITNLLNLKKTQHVLSFYDIRSKTPDEITKLIINA